MTEHQCHLVSGGYQERPYDHVEQEWHEWTQYFFCTIVNQTYIEIVNS
ncbi:MAG: hypothetical protein AB7I18_04620 [Candidatus Berkiella sp.]